MEKISVNPNEDQYLSVLRKVLETGTRQKNRTGIDTFMIPGAMMQFDLGKGFPAVTTKKFAMNACKGELIGFLRGYTSAADFRKLGCNFWDQNANENKAWLSNPHREGEDDLGYIYSRLWNDMPQVDSDGRKWNQIDELLANIRMEPTSRRLIVNSWHPEVFHRAALPPCHVMFQVIIEQGSNKMHMTMYQRACDFFLGIPMNIGSYSLLLELIAKWTGYIPGTFTWFGADCHIYENHVDQVKEQLSRAPLPPPRLILDIVEATIKGHISLVEPSEIQLEGYVSHPAIRAPMAV